MKKKIYGVEPVLKFDTEKLSTIKKNLNLQNFDQGIEFLVKGFSKREKNKNQQTGISFNI